MSNLSAIPTALFLVPRTTEQPSPPVRTDPTQAMEAAYLALCCAEDPCVRKLWLLHTLAERFEVPVVSNPIALARDIVGAAILASRKDVVYRACMQCGRNLTEAGIACESCVAEFRNNLLSQSNRIQFASDGKEGEGLA